MDEMKKPEILSPAGDPERLAAALLFGADAVYAAGKRFGMRSAPANFDEQQLQEASRLCRAQGKKLYITCNILPRNDEIDEYNRAVIDTFINSDVRINYLCDKAKEIDSSFIGKDGLHYTAEGASRLAKYVIEYLSDFVQ